MRVRRAVTRVHGKTRPALIYGRAGRAVLRCSLLVQTSRLEPPSSGEESSCVREAEWKPHCGWPGGSDCMQPTFLTLRGSKWNRHSRRAAPSGAENVDAALPPGCVREAEWKPHCGWPGGSDCMQPTFLTLRGSKWNRHSRRAAPSGAENVEAALPPGCVREAVWKSAQPPAYLKIFRQIIATPASAMPIRHFTVIFSLKNMRHIISDSISEPP